jgi:hypothetical protein
LIKACNTCTLKNDDCYNNLIFVRYGVKEVKKVKRLSGPGLEAEESPGIMQGGGKWPERYIYLSSR